MQQKKQGPVLTLRSRAPIRLDLAGGWTDVPPFSTEVGGAVVNAAINRYSYTTLKLHASHTISLVSADYDLSLSLPGGEPLVYDGKLDLLKAAINRLGPHEGLDLFVRADAPPGSGTGSSGATGIAILGVLNAVRQQPLSLHQLAELAHALEVEELKVAGGKQDQYAAALGGVNYLEFKDPYVSSSPLRLADSTINELEKRLILCYTGHARLSGNIISAVQGAYRAGNDRTVRALRRMAGIADEMRGRLLRGEVDALGPLLLENWACQKDLHATVTNADIDHLFDVALSHGATGGKALGAGGGGCLLFLAIADREHEVRKALLDERVEIMPFNLDRQGLQVWQDG
jgi:D-glycero-alpha-D-manno-heptose-7-phosphate kinase